MIRSSASVTARALATLTVLTVSTLSACSSVDAPEKVTDVRWQVTGIGDSNFDADTQTRTWITVGATTMTGASGCVQFTGDVAWSRSKDEEDATTSQRVTLSNLKSTTAEECATGDTYNADQMQQILTVPDLRWTFSDSSSMRHLRLWVDNDPVRGISFAG